MAKENCAKPDCNCELTAGSIEKDGKKYCGEFCASGEGASLEDCQCGHEECD
jgi:hypothetical protein